MTDLDRIAWREQRGADVLVCVLVVSREVWAATRWAVYLLPLGRYSAN